MKLRRLRTSATSPTPEAENERGLDFAWRTHTAITDWTAKVDSKASIVLGLGGVLLGFCVTLSVRGRALSGLTGWRGITEALGLAIISLGVLLTALVVAPRLTRRAAKQEWRDNFLYFGHLRYWQAEDLKRQLQNLNLDDELSVLSKQLVSTSKIAWVKHARLQFSMGLLGIGTFLVALSVVWPR